MEWYSLIVFVDLSKAFDHAIRELILGWSPADASMSADHKQQALLNLGIPLEHVASLVEWIDSTGGVLAACGADPDLIAMANSLHDGAWFRIAPDPTYIATMCGGRQGCKLGAIILI